MKEKMEQFQAINPNPVLSVQKDGTVLNSNETGESLLHEWGVKVGEKLPSSIVDLVQRVISWNSPEKMEVKVGNRIYLVVFSPLPEQECIAISGFNISDQKYLERELRVCEEDLAEVQKMAHIRNWKWNIITGELFWSDEVYRIFGLDPQEFEATFDAYVNYVHPDDRDYLKNAIKKAFEGEPYSVDNRIIKANGEERIVHTDAEIIFNEDNNPVCARGIIQDITERKRAGEVLKISEAKLRLAEVVAGIGHWEWDLKNNRVFWSEGNYRVLAYPINGIKPSCELWRARVHPDDIQSVEKIVFDAIRDGRSYHIDYRVLLPDGTVRHIIDSGNVLEKDASGNAVKFFGTMQDITDRKQAEEALRESDERHKTFFENSIDATLLTSPDGTIYAANPEACRIFGMTEEKIIQAGRDGIVDTSDPRLRLALEERARTGKFKGELNFRRKDGTIFPGDTSSAFFKDKNGAVRTSMVIRDVTERKKAEESLRESEERFSKAFYSSPSALCITRLSDGMFVDVNESYLKMFGYSWQELVGNTSTELGMYSADTVSRDELLNLFQKNGHIQNFEMNFRTKSGKSIRAIFSTEAINIKGQPYIITTFLDITDRKHAEEALKKAYETLEEKVKERTAELEEAYNSLLENEMGLSEAQKIAHLGNWDWNLLTDELYWSDEIYRIFRLDPLEAVLTHNKFLSYVDPDDRDIVYDSIQRALKGELFSIEYRINVPDGEQRIVHSQGEVVFDEKHTPIRIRGILQDITERKKTEETLAKIDQIRIKEIHHRIKNNLQIISSLLDLQAEKFEDANVVEAFKEGQNRVISMALIHEELYKGGETDKLDFSAYIKKLAENLFMTYNLSGKNIHLCIDLKENAFLDIDTAVPLGIIANELISNSLKHAFTENEEGEIRIQLCKDEEVSKETYKSIFYLTISDNGKGISEDLELGNAESLGLQLISILVDQLDGEIELKRENETEFTIRFTVPEIDNQALTPPTNSMNYD